MGFFKGGGGGLTVYRKTARWIEDDSLRAAWQIIFAVNLVLTATCGIGSRPQIDMVFLFRIPVAS